MKRALFGVWAFLVVAILASGCAGTGALPPAASPNGTAPVPAAGTKIEAILLQINDVYEIGPVANGTQGGLAKVARVRQELLAENPHTFTLLAGDFVSPSALGTARVDGERLAGRQMVASLNTMGLDIATFGNHEFDIKESQLRERLAESKFRWTSANVSDSTGQPFPGVSSHEVLTVPGAGGQTLRIGIVGVTTTKNAAEWVTYKDPVGAMRAEVAAIGGEVDVLVGLTHLAVDTDQVVAEQTPELAAILGGHEHENFYLRRGPRPTPIVKADANAKSVYIHRLSWDPVSREVEIESEYLPITDAIEDEPETAAVVADWTKRGFDGFRADGFEPEAVVAEIPEELDGLESSVRNRPTNLTRLITDAMVGDVSEAELAVFNGGSIRIDDKLPAGAVTQYDVIRILPFGGAVLSTRISGDLLARALDQGLSNQGSGGYLQTTANVERNADGWAVGGEALVADRLYTVAISDYLAGGNEVNLEWLDVDAGNPEFQRIGEHSDIRQALIAELRRRYP